MQVSYKKVNGVWQTWIKATDYYFGPTFPNLKDLWKWQRENLLGNPDYNKFMSKERIKELALNVDLISFQDIDGTRMFFIGPNSKPYHFEKFAIDIIKECCEIVSNADDKETAVQEIKTNFDITD